MLTGANKRGRLFVLASWGALTNYRTEVMSIVANCHHFYHINLQVPETSYNTILKEHTDNESIIEDEVLLSCMKKLLLLVMYNICHRMTTVIHPFMWLLLKEMMILSNNYSRLILIQLVIKTRLRYSVLL